MIKSILKRMKERRARKKYRRHPLQDTPAAPRNDLVTLGSAYGGWTFHDDGNLNGTTIISAGLGEDASFDVEFAARYDARVILVDPTQRAIEHFEGMSDQIGQARARQYVDGGTQPFDAYELGDVTDEQLVLEPLALWTERTSLRFFKPENPDHVSHSIVNFQNDYRDDSDSVAVDACTLAELLEKYEIGPDALPLLKLDIEGAEIEVLQNIMDAGIRPKQICVEYDELGIPSETAFKRVDQAHASLTNAGYRCVYSNGTTDYLYLLE